MIDGRVRRLQVRRPCVDPYVVHVSVRRLPKLTVVLVLGFAEAEAHGLYSALELFRGFAIQIAYRWALGAVVAADGDRAVLMWSPVGPSRSAVEWIRRTVGMVLAVLVGLALFALSNLVLIMPFRLVLGAVGVSTDTVQDVCVGILGVRLLVTLWRALRAYLHDANLQWHTPASRHLQWRLDYMAAVPARRGSGSALLRTFLAAADRQDVEVVLNCQPPLVPFYRRHGFRVARSELNGQQIMTRQPASVRRAAGPQDRKPSVRRHAMRLHPAKARAGRVG